MSDWATELAVKVQASLEGGQYISDDVEKIGSAIRYAAARGTPQASEETGTLYAVEFVAGKDEDRPAGTYITIRIDRDDLRWSAGRMAVRYIPDDDKAE